MKKKVVLLFIFGLFILGFDVNSAAIYEYYDGSGVLHLTNIPISVPAKRYNVFTPDKNIMLNRAKRYSSYIRQYAKIYKVPQELIVSIIMSESSFVPTAVSAAGAYGLMQVTKNTADFMKMHGSLFNPQMNIYVGVKYLRFLLTYFKNDMIKAIAAYNAGPKRIIQYKGVPPYPETQDFVRNVLENYYELLQARSAGTTAVLYSGIPATRSQLYIYYDVDGNLRITDVKKD